MVLFDGPYRKISIPNNLDRSSVCLTAVVIFAPLRWWGMRKSFTFYFLITVGKMLLLGDQLTSRSKKTSCFSLQEINSVFRPFWDVTFSVMAVATSR